MSGTILDRDRIYTLLKVLVIVLLVAIGGAILLAAMPALAGADESYTVLSDSMSPAIKAGAVVFVDDVPSHSIDPADVITFQGDGSDGPTTTHRVVEVVDQEGSTQYITKGDANDDPDATLVPGSAVVGKVSFHIPLIGYVVSFANTQWGILSLVVVPAILLVGLELRDLLYTDDEPEDES